MPRTKTRPSIRDFVDDDAKVIATEGFTPPMGTLVERGRYYTLSAPVVQKYPQFFAVVVPVDEVLGEIHAAKK
jgi:hypothetical protein